MSQTAQKSAPSGQVPSIRTFQFNEGGVGKLKDSVNLFRGDVNYHLPLLSLPGRVKHDGLSVNVSLIYESNTWQQATRWNLEAPTGVVGLGWSLPVDRISLVASASPSPKAREYELESKGNRNRLAREPLSRLFVLSSDSVKSLPEDSGQWAQVSDVLRQQFADSYYRLSPEAEIAKDPASPSAWSIKDDVSSQQFTIFTDSDGASYFAGEGGEAYQMQNFRFWKILYYPIYERWVVVKENGVVFSYGGDASDGSQEKAVRWGVAEDGREVGVWQGSSDYVSDSGAITQQQYVRAWNLAQVTDPWGDAIRYRYNELGDATGLQAADVEQSVGSAEGLKYTKASYLTSIMDVFQRRVTFNYENKLYSAEPEDPREYADPHKKLEANASPGLAPENLDAPNAYQDRYETKFLSRMVVDDESSDLMFSLDFVYEPGGDASGVKNVNPESTYSGDLYGDTFKRFLTSVVRRNVDGVTLPGASFDYYLDPSDVNPGAIQSITSPEGSTGVYAYERQSLTCEPQAAVEPPSEAGLANPSPRVWFGADYVVSVWEDHNEGLLSLELYTWTGQWIAWTPVETTLIYSDSDHLFDPETLVVQTGRDFCSLYFQSESAGQTFVYLYQKDPAKAGEWVPISANASAGCAGTAGDLPYHFEDQYIVFDQLWTHDGEDLLQFVNGDRFLAVYDQPDHLLVQFTYSWLTKSWDCRHQTIGDDDQRVQVTGQGEYVFLLQNAVGEELNATVRLESLDSLGVWSSSSTSPFHLRSLETVRLAAGDSLVAMTWSEVRTDDSVSYLAGIVQWDGDYRILEWPADDGDSSPVFQPPSVDGDYSFRDYLPPSGDYNLGPSTLPHVTGNALAAWNGHMMRFDGNTWQVDSGLVPEQDFAPAVQRYAYGADIVVQSYYQDLEKAFFNAYDPDTGTFHLKELSADPADGSDSISANWPTATRSAISVGSYFYQRPTGEPWADAGDPEQFAELKSGASVIDQGPDFVCYMKSTTGNASQAALVPLKNGRGDFSNPVMIGDPSGEALIYWVPKVDKQFSYGQGTYPAGPASLVTYDSGDFTAAQVIYTQRYVTDTMTETIDHRSVKSLKIHDGDLTAEASYQAAYVYDGHLANCDPSGRVAKYYRTTLYPGFEARPQDPVYGKKVNTYINGVSRKRQGVIVFDAEAKVYDQMLDGHLSRVEVYDRASKLLARSKNHWYVYRSRSRVQAGVLKPQEENIFGGFAVKTSERHEKDGVRVVTEKDYRPKGLEAPLTGQMVKTSQSAEVLVFAQDPRQPLANDVEKRTTSIMYAYEMPNELGKQLWARHMLKSVAQETAVAERGGEAWILSASASTYKAWSASDGSKTPAMLEHLSYVGSADAKSFIGYYDRGRVPSDWFRKIFYADRTVFGQGIEVRNVAEIEHSVLYDRGFEFPIASFSNAGRHQCAYLGFEAYEVDERGEAPNSNWIYPLQEGVKRVPDRAHTGSWSLEIPAGATQGFEVQMTDANLRQAPDADVYYLVGFCYKTDGGGAGSQMKVAVTVKQGEPPAVDPVAFDATGGAWRYCSRAILVPKGAGKVVFTLSAENRGASELWLDDLHCNPLICGFAAHTYDPRFRYQIDTFETGGQTHRVLRDRFNRVVCNVGPGLSTDVADSGQVADRTEVRSLKQSFLSRQGRASDAYDPEDPNAAVQLNAADGGFCDDFRDSIWMSHWNVSPSKVCYAGEAAGQASTPWCVDGGVLLQTQASSQTLALADAERSPGSWALYFEVLPMRRSGGDLAPAQSLAAQLAIRFGDNTLAWDPTSHWTFNGAGDALADPPRMARGWLLIVGEAGAGVRPVLFYAGGQLIFSDSLPDTDEVFSDLRIETGDNLLGLRNLSYLRSLHMAVQFHDASGRTTQAHHLHEGDAWVDLKIFDFVGREVAQTKTVPASFAGSPDTRKLMQPLPVDSDDGLVNLPAFVGHPDDPGSGTMNSSGLLTGAVAKYYSGKSYGPIASSDDAGFPYSRKVYEASPLERVSEMAMPGKDHAYVADQSAADRPTTRYAYSNLEKILTRHPVQGVAVPETAGIFAVVQDVPSSSGDSSPSFVKAVNLKNTFGEKVGTITYGEGGALIRQSFELQQFDERGLRTVHIRPNHFAAGDKFSDDAFFCYSVQHDMLHHPIVEEGPDIDGQILSMFDNLGRLRFKKLAGDAPIIYHKYDDLGRLLETGTFQAEWEMLAKYVDQRTWPGSAVYPHAGGDPPQDLETAQYRFYDNFGSDLQSPARSEGDAPTQLGKLTREVRLNRRELPAGAGNVTVQAGDSYSYFHSGLRSEERQVIDQQGSTGAKTLDDSSVSYDYHADGTIQAIHYPQSSPIKAVFRGYDDLGHLQAVRLDSAAAAPLASYVYGPAGLAQETLAGDSDLVVKHRYDSVGHPEATTLEAIDGSLEYSRTLDGRVKTFDYQDKKQRFSGTYGYDPLQRLESATTVPPDLSLLVKNTVGAQASAYDLNGNPIHLIHDPSGAPVETSFDLASGSDRMQTAGGQSVAYDDSGYLTASPQLVSAGGNGLENSVAYDRESLLTKHVDVKDGDELKSRSIFSYGHGGQRVFKQVVAPGGAASSRAYVYGQSKMPLAEREDGGTTAYVYGAKGLVLLDDGDGRYMPIHDDEGTVRAVLGSDLGVEASFAYFPFGALEEPKPSFSALRYLYTGQEYDQELGLYNYRARLYDPWLCRFYSPDPKHQFSSPYLYVGDEPMGMIDPTGEAANFLTGLFAGIGEALAGAITFNPVLMGLGASGMIYSVKNRDHFSIQDFGMSQIGAGIGAVEVAIGVTIAGVTGFTGGSGGIAAAVFIGAGMSGMSYSTFHSGQFDWAAYGKETAIGGVGGAVTGGAGLAVAKATTSLGWQIAGGIAAGVTSSASGQSLRAAFQMKKADGTKYSMKDLGSPQDLVGDAISGVLGAVGPAISSRSQVINPQIKKNVQAFEAAHGRPGVLARGLKAPKASLDAFKQSGQPVAQLDKTAGRQLSYRYGMLRTIKPFSFNSKKLFYPPWKKKVPDHW